MSARQGISLLELMIGLTLGGLVLSAGAATLHSQTRLARAARAQVQHNEVLRITTQVLALETRWLASGRDLRDWSADSLALRAFRASGTVCQLLEDGSALIGLNALRAPDAAKDSALILRDSVTELTTRFLLAASSPAPCGSGRSYIVRSTQSLQPGDALLVFESGTYYLADRALRYRLGGEGRQPLTEEVFDPLRTYFSQMGRAGSAALRTVQLEKQAQLHLQFLGNRP